MRNPALILITELPWTVDTAHAHDRGTKTKDPRIVAGILVGGAFRAAIGAVELQRPGLCNAAARQFAARDITVSRLGQLDVVDRAIDLVGRGEDQPGRVAIPAQCFQQFEGAARIDREVRAGIVEAGRHCDLGGQVKHRADIGHGFVEARRIAQIGNRHPQTQRAVLRQ